MSAIINKSIHPLAMISNVHIHRHLIYSMIKREVIGRYRGSFFGLLWSFFNPILMLTVYTFCFSYIFKARWAVDEPGGQVSYTAVLFVGLIIHGLFSEAITRAPHLITGHANYVKKIVFPVDVLPYVSIGSSLFHASLSTLILIVANLLLGGHVYWTILLFPLVLLPFILLIVGLSWLLAAVGVYVKDISQFTSILITILLFLSPVFYSLSALPESFRRIALFNPLTLIIEESRGVLLYGKLPNLDALAIYSLISFFIAWFSFICFQKMRKGFSDVL